MRIVSGTKEVSTLKPEPLSAIQSFVKTLIIKSDILINTPGVKIYVGDLAVGRRLQVGETVRISGSDFYNGNWDVRAVTDNSFSIPALYIGYGSGRWDQGSDSGAITSFSFDGYLNMKANTLDLRGAGLFPGQSFILECEQRGNIDLSRVYVFSDSAAQIIEWWGLI